MTAFPCGLNITGVFRVFIMPQGSQAMPTHAVSVRRVVHHIVVSEPGEGQKLLPGSPLPISTYATIQLVSSDGAIHVRVNGADTEDYQPGAQYDITITPKA